MRHSRGNISSARQRRAGRESKVLRHGQTVCDDHAVILRGARGGYATGSLKRANVAYGISQTSVCHGESNRNGFAWINNAVGRQTAFADQRRRSGD